MAKIQCKDCDGFGYHNDGEAEEDLCKACEGDGVIEITEAEYHAKMQALKMELQQLDLGGA